MGVEDDKVWHRRRRSEQDESKEHSEQRSTISLLLLRQQQETFSAHAAGELFSQFPATSWILKAWGRATATGAAKYRILMYMYNSNADFSLI